MGKPATTLSCSGCGYVVPPGEKYPFRCPKCRPGDDIDHVLRETFSSQTAGLADSFDSKEANPFLKYRKLFHSYHTALAWGLSDADYVEIVRRLDDAVAKVDGRGFAETPFEPVRFPVGPLWVKDETGNISGSHKARHLMGIMIWLEGVRRAFPKSTEPTLAIASCGNAALGAAVVAKAAGRPLEVCVPPNANPNVIKRLQELGARLVYCPRETNEPGDPCYLRFKKAIAGGAFPFTVQGNENGLTISGGKTLAYEMVSRLRREKRSIDRLFIQVGGGALASSIFQGLQNAKALGLIDRLPRIHAVQTEGGYPLARAYEKIAKRIRDRCPNTETNDVPKQILDEELWFAAIHRSSFMWPWETEPKSVAHGILDDETYDWFAVVEGMLRTGGTPVIVSEKNLEDAYRLCREHTSIRADHTGTAGLAGVLKLQQTTGERPGETVAVLFTGVER